MCRVQLAALFRLCRGAIGNRTMMNDLVVQLLALRVVAALLIAPRIGVPIIPARGGCPCRRQGKVLQVRPMPRLAYCPLLLATPLRVVQGWRWPARHPRRIVYRESPIWIVPFWMLAISL